MKVDLLKCLFFGHDDDNGARVMMTDCVIYQCRRCGRVDQRIESYESPLKRS